MIHHLENAGNNVGFYDNDSKPEFIGFTQQISIETVSVETLTSVESFA